MNSKNFENLLHGSIEHLEETGSVYVADLKDETYIKLKNELLKAGYNTYFDDDKLRLINK